MASLEFPMSGRGLLVGACLLAAYLPVGAAADPLESARTELVADAACFAPSAPSMVSEPLRRTAWTIHEGHPLKIVAIGSSSTQGHGASTDANSYPKQLESILSARLGGLPVEVVNKGVGGELASEMLARFERDVLAERPALVIWQTGSNDITRAVPVTEFRAQIADGISRLKEAGIDVIVMSPQYYPRLQRYANHQAYIDAMRSIAGGHKVALLCRFTVMREWTAQGAWNLERALSGDRFHMSDSGYYCLGKLLADAIARNVERQRFADARWHGDGPR